MPAILLTLAQLFLFYRCRFKALEEARYQILLEGRWGKCWGEENQGFRTSKKAFPATKHFKGEHSVLADWAIVNKAWARMGVEGWGRLVFSPGRRVLWRRGIREPAGRQLSSRTGLSPFLLPKPPPLLSLSGPLTQDRLPFSPGVDLTLHPQWPLINCYSLISTIMSSTFPILRLKMELIEMSSLY